MDKEIWKDIVGYEGMYQISNFGRVKSLTRKYKKRNISKDIIKVPTKLPKGYLKVGLCKNGKVKYYFIHRLVAEMFIPKIYGKDFVNHKDCNTSNNCVENLEWCNCKENNSYKNHNLKRNISSMLYFLKKNYPNEKEIIKLVEKLKGKINVL